MLLKDIQIIFHKELDLIYGENEVASFFYILIDHYFKLPIYITALEPDYLISKDKESTLFAALAKLKNQVPIQYIIGEWEFFGLPFKLSKEVLIPRPETEELISFVLQEFQNKIPKPKTLTILDIGTGSGCIAISLAKNLPNAEVYAIDVSSDALKIAKQNADLNKADVTFFELDILNEALWNAVFANRKFDTIVSNPPYIRNLEKQAMKPNVLDNEPHLALFVSDENPLLFYEKIIEFAKKFLVPKGSLYFEINEHFGKEICNLLEMHSFYKLELKQDMYGKDRMIKAIKK